MAPTKPPGYRRFIYAKLHGKYFEISNSQWQAISALAPTWELFDLKDICGNTRRSLKRRGWAEFRMVADEFVQGRLTTEGLKLRDDIEYRLARRHARALGWSMRGWR
jgi:hypothetical protein